MKTNSITIIALLFYATAFSQMQNIKAENFNFKIKSDFTLLDTGSKRIKLTDTINVENERIIKTVYINPEAINPITNNIQDVSDLLNLETISFMEDDFIKEKKIDGITEINGKRILFREKIKETYDDYNFNNLIGYEYSNIYYFFLSKNQITSIEYKVHIDTKETEILEHNTIAKLMAKNINLGDINDIINSLE